MKRKSGVEPVERLPSSAGHRGVRRLRSGGQTDQENDCHCTQQNLAVPVTGRGGLRCRGSRTA
jgi:hypothetical protein